MPAPFLSDAFAEELDSSNPSLLRSITFNFVGETVRLSDVALCMPDGLCEPLIKSWGVIERNGGSTDCHLVDSFWTALLVVDLEREWETRAARNKVKGIEAIYTWASWNVDEDDWFSRVFAILKWRYVEEGLVSVTLGPPLYDVLASPLPSQPITSVAFPNLPKELEGFLIPVGPYGEHNSYGNGAIDGTIKPVLVDPVNFIYLIGACGCIQMVMNAYGDGVRFLPTAWTLLQVTIDGVTYALIQFTNDQSNKEVTLDVRGWTENGDGTGDLLNGPIAILRHGLANLIYKEKLDAQILGSPWFTDSDAPISTPHLDATEEHLETRTPTGARASFYRSASNEQYDGASFVNDLCETNQIKPFFTIDNLLAVSADPLDPVGYVDEPHIQRVLHELDTGPLKPVEESEGSIGTVVVEGGISEATDAITERLEVNAQPESREGDTIHGRFGEAHI